uniref:Uncharacterized protein n=1 Tax=Setaria italica TaxID=4555 RepID=K3ZYR3_SETIT
MSLHGGQGREHLRPAEVGAKLAKVAVIVLEADGVQLLPQDRDRVHDQLIGCDGTSCFHGEDEAVLLCVDLH